MDFWIDLSSFALKSAWIAAMIAVALAIPALAAARSRMRPDDDGLKIASIDDRFDRMEAQVLRSTQDKKVARRFLKERKRAAEKRADDTKCLYVIDFRGDPLATGHAAFARKITAALLAARAGQDEVVVTIQSPGGLVSAYGLMAAQMQRVRQAGVQLTACVDQVAASGGYMMAVAANTIIAAPFAVVGSIGVVAQVPNVQERVKSAAGGVILRPRVQPGDHVEQHQTLLSVV